MGEKANPTYFAPVSNSIDVPIGRQHLTSFYQTKLNVCILGVKILVNCNDHYLMSWFLAVCFSIS